MSALIPDKSTEKKRIVVLDSNSIMHRAFHGLPQTMKTPDNRPSNAVFGYMKMFCKMLEIFNPDAVVCAFDKGKPQARIDMYEKYKSHRPPMDPNLRVQFGMIKELLECMQVPIVLSEGWEGDDILGTLAQKGFDLGFNMYLITGDRDMFQLSNDLVKIVSTQKGMSEIAIMTPESVEDLYGGITPELIPDFYGLKGDSSDEIPGVPKIGAKTASKLIMQYGDLESVIAHADEVKGKLGESLRENIELARLSKCLATIRRDAPIDIDLEEVVYPQFMATAEAQAQVKAKLNEFGMGSIVRSLFSYSLLDGSEGDSSALTSQFKVPEVIDSVDAWELLRQEVDLKDTHVGLAIDAMPRKNELFSLGDTLVVATIDRIYRIQNELSEALDFLIQNGKIASLDFKSLLHSWLKNVEGAKVEDVTLDTCFDAGVAAYLLDSSRGEYGAEYLLQTYVSPDIMLLETQNEAEISAYTAILLKDELEQKLKDDNSYELFAHIETPLIRVLCAMEKTGMYADPVALETQSEVLAQKIAEITKDIYKEAHEEFNVNSSEQLSRILFDVLGLPTQGLKKTKKGYYSTNAQVLEQLAESYEIVENVLLCRGMTKLKSTYLDALPKLIGADGRIHTTLNQTVTATGRLSSSNPNLQNIPTRSEEGRVVRQAFSVPENSVFLTCDYSQIELRLLAHLSGDEHLIKAFNEGADFHAATASRVFGVPIDEVSKELRSHAKAVNFGIVYGQQAFGLAQSLGVTRAKAQAMIDRYFEAYPGVREFLDETVAFARQNHWVATMYNRKRHIPTITSSNFNLRSFAERTAMNHPMQGSAADIIKIAMNQVLKRMEEEKLKSRLIMQIHDELDFEVPLDELDILSELVRYTMEHVAELKVPLLAEVSYGKTWADAK